MSVNGTEYLDQVILGKRVGFVGTTDRSYPDLASVPAGLPAGSIIRLGTGEVLTVDANGALRPLLGTSTQAQATLIDDVVPPQLQSAVVAAVGQKVIEVHTDDGQVQVFLQPTSVSDGEVIYVRHASGDVPATLLSIASADGINGGPGQTFALNPNTYVQLAASAASNLWMLVGHGTDANRTSS